MAYHAFGSQILNNHGQITFIVFNLAVCLLRQILMRLLKEFDDCTNTANEYLT